MSDGWHVDPLTLREVVADRAELERRFVDATPADRVWLLRVLGRLDDALTLGQRLLRERSTFRVLLLVAHVHQWRGEFDRAELQQRARALAVGDRQLAFVEQHVGKRLFDSGRYREALGAFAAALTLRQRCGAPEDQLLSSRVAVQRAGELASRSIDQP